MRIYPAIDIKNGECVRLSQGRFDDVTVFYKDPVEVAKMWEGAGAEFLHIVDLDGAADGFSKNFDVVASIVKSVNIPVQIGGGIRTANTIESYIQNGINRVILGTAAIKDIDFTKAAIEKYGDKIVIGIDAKDGFAAVEGWMEVSDRSAVDFAKQVERWGAKTIIYTDISKDGMLSGPNFEAMEQMANSVSCDVIASGGVSSIEDIEKLKTCGVEGAIVGKALYVNKINISEAIIAGRC